MASKQKKSPMVSIPTRLPAALLEGVDAYVARLEKKNPGLSLSRAEAVRMLLRDGLVQAGIKFSEPVRKTKAAG